MKVSKLGFDYDGVLADSRATAFAIVEEIAGLFGIGGPVTSMREYRAVLAGVERMHAPEGRHNDVVRALHRLLMRTRAPNVPLFGEVILLARGARVPTAVISSSLRGAIAPRLDAHDLRVDRIFSHEDGHKDENLAAWANGGPCVYVTDNVTDVEHCHRLGIAVIAVGWGFDSKSDLIAAKPAWFVEAPSELRDLLLALQLITLQ